FPATSVDVEWLFSHGRLLLSHVHSQLSAQTMRAILRLGYWIQLGLIKIENMQTVAALADV
ncbi:hypothetical protein BDR03DRAFT_868391, partial [Suillus americanus]